MALSFGRKKPQDTPVAAPLAAPPSAPTSDQAFTDAAFNSPAPGAAPTMTGAGSDDILSFSMPGSDTIPHGEPVSMTAPAHPMAPADMMAPGPPTTTVFDAPPAPAPRRKAPVLPLALAGLVLLVGAGGAYYWMNSQKAPEDQPVPFPQGAPRTHPVGTRVAAVPGAKTPKATSKPAPVKPGVKATGSPKPTVKPTAAAKPVGTAKPAGTNAPLAKGHDAKTPLASAPNLAPTPKVVTAPQPPDGSAGTPGFIAKRYQVSVVQAVAANTTVPVNTKPISATLQKRLDALWQQGADAKHRHDYAGARRAWKKALSLDPGHAGFQTAIDRLP